MLGVHLIPRTRNLCRSEASNSEDCRSSNPSRSATISRVMSSLVGPRPPVTKRISQRGNSSASVCRIASVSPTVRRSSMRKPNEKISCAMNARCASCTSPSKSSVPVLRSATRIRRGETSQSYNVTGEAVTLLPCSAFNFLTCPKKLRGSGGAFVLFLAN
jgi:hypothetical protein